MIYFLYYWYFEQNYIEFTTSDEMEKVSRKKGKDIRDLAYALTLSLAATLRLRISGMKNRSEAFNTTWNIMCIPGPCIVIWEQRSFHLHSARHGISRERNPCVLGLFGQGSLLYYFVTRSRRSRLSKTIFFLKKKKNPTWETAKVFLQISSFCHLSHQIAASIPRFINS